MSPRRRLSDAEAASLVAAMANGGVASVNAVGAGGSPHVHPESEITNLTVDLAAKAAAAHTHAHAATTGQTADDHHAKSHVHLNDGSGTVAYTSLSGTPSTFAPAAHGSAHNPGGSDAVATATPTIALGTAAAAGVATSLVRSDATLLAFDATSPSTQAVGDAAVVGVVNLAARRDHKHAMPAFGAASGTIAQGNDARFATNLERVQRVFASPVLTTTGTFTTVSTTAYFVYLGRTVASVTPKFVEVFVTTIGTNTVVEYGFFSTPNPPSKAAQTLTKLVTAAGATTLVVNAANRNTSAMATAIPAGTHLWAGFRTTSSVVPVCRGLADDWGQGHLLALAAAGTFAATSTFAGAVPAAATQVAGVALRGTLD